MNSPHIHKRPIAHAIALSMLASAAMVAPNGNARAVDVQAATTQAAAGQTQTGAAPATSKKTGKKAGKKATQLKTIVVTGMLGSQMRSIDLKRTAPSIQDSISAEDIGKLPDVTISDSLQRITGVQIDRSGGEGSSVNVRGLPQVTTTLNGEVFLSADNIVSMQPNFADIPSQLFAGADVVKSPTGSMLGSGISGTINLRTRRPWDLKPGWTATGAATASHGSEVDKTQPNVNGLIGFNDGGRWGFLLSAAYSDLTHQSSQNAIDQYGGLIYGENAASATSYNGFLNAFGSAPIPSEIAQLGGGNVDVNGDGKADGAFPGVEDTTVFDRQIERKRLGVNASFQAAFGSGLTLTSDAFFTREDQFDRYNGYQLNSATWLGGTFVPLVTRDTGQVVHGAYNNNEGWNQEFYVAPVRKKWLGDMETYSQDNVTRSISRNFNVELKYDNGGAFTGDLRFINASAHQLYMSSYVQFTDADGTAWPNDPVDAASPGTYIYPASLGGNRVFNPNGFAPNTVPVTIDTRGTHYAITLPSELQSFLSQPNNYVLKTISSEGNHDRRSGMNIVRADGHYNFEDGFRLDFGIRNSIRTASNINFNLVAPVYAGNGASDPNGCLVRWKAADVVLNGGGIAGACSAGDAQGFYRAGVLSAQNISQLPGLLKNHFKKYSNLAGVQGVSIYNIDPKVMDNVYDFQEALYPGEQRNVDPGGTWDVKLKETTAYLQGDFDGQLDSVPFSGNVGVRLVRTNLHVTQHAVGAAQPYGLLAADNGSVYTNRSYTDVLPALNVAFDLTPKVKMRFAYSKNMMPLNLDQWGGGLTLNYGIDTSTPGSTIFRVLGGSSTGNPDLKPWRSSNYGMSLEYYVNDSTMLSAALFYIDVASSIANGSIKTCSLPDQDGVVRNRCVVITSPLQAEGHSLHGVELDYKQAFTSLPGFLSHTGIHANYTYSPSDTGGKDMAGNPIPFQDNSKNQANLVLWYQDNKLEARVAGNYRSKRAVLSNWGGISGMEMYQAPTFYVDASVSYQINKHVQLYLQGSNLTGEHEKYYLVWKDFSAHNTFFERRYMLGVRVNF